MHVNKSPQKRSRIWLAGAVILLAGIAAATISLWPRTPPEPETAGTAPGFRRLNEGQYLRSIQQIFGSHITVPTRFEPDLREEGLLAIGNSKVIVTPSGFEQHELRAREIAQQVLDEEHRADVLKCSPETPSDFDANCAREFYTHYGRLIFRRPLSDGELNETLGIAETVSTETHNFYTGLELGLTRLLVSPFFTFRVEASEPDPDGAGERLGSFSLATRISFLLWDAPPDDELLDAAASGALYRKGVLDGQVQRMMASPKFENGVRAFFSDMFAYDGFEGLNKEQSIYKKFNSQLAVDAREQMLRTIINHLIKNNGDYRDLFSTRKTFLNRNLAAVYRVPVEGPAFDSWMPYEFKPDDQRQGLLTSAGFLMLDPTHEGRTSPTNRGMAVRELLLCQKVPPPPSDVDFTVAQETDNPLYKTARDRLTAHRTNPTCAGCHAIMDPLGLAMEKYDTIGQYRERENGVPIDDSGEFEGKAYNGLIELQGLLRESPSLPSCLVRRTYEYGIGHSAGSTDREWLDYMTQQFAADGYQLPTLMQHIATSKAFAAVAVDTVASN